MERREDELKDIIPSQVIKELASKQQRHQTQVLEAQKEAEAADKGLEKNLVIQVGTAEMGEEEIQEAVEGIVGRINDAEKEKEGEEEKKRR